MGGWLEERQGKKEERVREMEGKEKEKGKHEIEWSVQKEILSRKTKKIDNENVN